MIAEIALAVCSLLQVIDFGGGGGGILSLFHSQRWTIKTHGGGTKQRVSSCNQFRHCFHPKWFVDLNWWHMNVTHRKPNWRTTKKKKKVIVGSINFRSGRVCFKGHAAAGAREQRCCIFLWIYLSETEK